MRICQLNMFDAFRLVKNIFFSYVYAIFIVLVVKSNFRFFHIVMKFLNVEINDKF